MLAFALILFASLLLFKHSLRTFWEFDTSEFSFYFKKQHSYFVVEIYELFHYISNDEYSSHQYYLKTTWITKIWNEKKFNKKWDWIIVAVIDSWLNHNNLDIKHSIWNN